MYEHNGLCLACALKLDAVNVMLLLGSEPPGRNLQLFQAFYGPVTAAVQYTVI